MPRKTTEEVRQLRTSTMASMRPRPDAAENVPDQGVRVGGEPGFNEAAARCRGKPGEGGEERMRNALLQ